VIQGDLFEALDRPADDGPKPYVYRPNLEEIRGELRAVVDEVRAASVMPWDQRTLLYHRKVVPQMSRWLPDEEREEICREFEAEVARLTAA
jgi:hypothetical protein